MKNIRNIGPAAYPLTRATIVIHEAQKIVYTHDDTRQRLAAKFIFDKGLFFPEKLEMIKAGMPWILENSGGNNAETANGIRMHFHSFVAADWGEENADRFSLELHAMMEACLPQVSPPLTTSSCFPEFAVPELAVRSNRALAGLFVASSLRSRLYRV